MHVCMRVYVCVYDGVFLFFFVYLAKLVAPAKTKEMGLLAGGVAVCNNLEPGNQEPSKTKITPSCSKLSR